MKRYRDEVLARHRAAIGKEIEGKPATLSGLMAVVPARRTGARLVAGERSRPAALQANDRGVRPHDGGVLMNAIARRPIDGAFRSWSDGRQVHLLVRFTGGNLGRSPVTMHADDRPGARRARRSGVTS